jgi:hypothetical protein
MFLQLIKGAVMMVFGKQSTTFGLALSLLQTINKAWEAFKAAREGGGEWDDFALELIYPFLPDYVTGRLPKQTIDELLESAKVFVNKVYRVKQLLKAEPGQETEG